MCGTVESTDLVLQSGPRGYCSSIPGTACDSRSVCGHLNWVCAFTEEVSRTADWEKVLYQKPRLEELRDWARADRWWDNRVFGSLGQPRLRCAGVYRKLCSAEAMLLYRNPARINYLVSFWYLAAPCPSDLVEGAIAQRWRKPSSPPAPWFGGSLNRCSVAPARGRLNLRFCSVTSGSVGKGVDDITVPSGDHCHKS